MNKKPFKFSYGDQVFWLDESGIRKGFVIRIEYLQAKNKENLLYHVIANLEEVWEGFPRKESQIFSTKEELIEHLRSQSDE